MQIVIDINEHIYKQIMADSEVYILDNEVDRILIENAIYNGTPLPEHHGDLIDRDELKSKIMYAEDKAYETWDELYDCVLEDIENAPTIIEADKEG